MCGVFLVKMFLVMKWRSSYDLCFNVDLSVKFLL